MKKTVIAILLALLVLTGCGSSGEPTQTTAAPVSMDLKQVYASVTALENMPEMLPLDPDMQLNFCGIDSADCAQAVVAICSDGLRADEIWLIEAVDASALERLQELAQNRLTAKAEESITYSPEQYAVVQKAQVITVDNYLAVFVSPEVDAVAAVFRNAAGI